MTAAIQGTAFSEEAMSGASQGRCACGAVRFRLTSPPIFVHCCHGLNGQRHTGSAFVINLLIEASRAEVTGGAPGGEYAPRGRGEAS